VNEKLCVPCDDDDDREPLPILDPMLNMNIGNSTATTSMMLVSCITFNGVMIT